MDAIEIALTELAGLQELWREQHVWRIEDAAADRVADAAMITAARAELAALRAQAEPVGCGGDKSTTLRAVTDSWRERE